MPVWHALTERFRDDGRLAVVGITQEQHPDRTRLFARWQGLDWPILWDPFNLSGSAVVPRMILVDEHGVVRSTRARPHELETFLATEHAPPAAGTVPPAADPGAPRLLAAGEAAWREQAREALSDLLWGRGDVDAAIEALERDLAAVSSAARSVGAPDLDAYATGVLAPTTFRLGVAHRMRHDGPGARPGDFQRALDLWAAALELDPNQYIWRRRLQQYGPRLDKPYPFYPWIDEARDALRARGEEVAPLSAALTETERAGPGDVTGGPGASGADEPDPRGRIDRDGRLVTIDVAVAAVTRDAEAVRAHVRLRPDDDARAHWNNEVEPLRVWLDLPEGLAADGRLHEAPMPDEPLSSEPRLIDVELERAPGAPWPERVDGYALYYVCEDVDGQCLYRRQDFTIPLAHLAPSR